MKLSITELLKQTKDLLKKDKIIFGPPIISAFIIYTITLQFPVNKLLDLSLNSILIILLLMAIYIITFGFVVNMVNALHRDSPITPALFKSVLKTKSVKLLLSAFCIYIPLTLFIIAVQYFASFMVGIPIVSSLPILKNFVGVFSGLISIVGAIFCMYILFFLPIYIVIEGKGIGSTLKSALNIVINHLSRVILVSCIVINIKIVFSILSLLFLAVPVLGQSFFLVLFKGISDTIVYSLFVVFYFKIKTFNKTTPPITVDYDKSSIEIK